MDNETPEPVTAAPAAAQPAAAEMANKWKEGYERLSAIINSLPESFDPVLDDATNKAINEARALAALAQAAAVPEAAALNAVKSVKPKTIGDTTMYAWADGAKAYALGWNECRLAVCAAIDRLAAPEAGAGGGK